MKELIVIDDFLSDEHHHELYELTLAQDFQPVNDQKDNHLSGISGYNSIVPFQDRGVQIILSACLEHSQLLPAISTSFGQAIYNKYDPRTTTYFHYDGEESCWTLIYFPHFCDYNYQMGGETQILVDNQIIGVLPLPNRLMAFDGSLMHKGTSFTHDQPRYSLALQFGD
jgi:hypothetical protein